MKLRNKKTGKRGWIAECNNYFIVVYPVNEKWEAYSDEKYVYHSLSEVCEDWEDYEPVEPLIEDEKARKVFREWADFFGAERFRVNHHDDSRRKTTVIRSTDLSIEPSIELPGRIGEDSEIYTRVELCGSEE